MQYYTDFIFVENQPEKADMIFVPGGPFPEIAQRAAGLWREGFSPYVLVSGKYSILNGAFSGPASQAEAYPGKFDTEAAFLAYVLGQEGVAPGAILQETEATFTYENAIFSRRLTDSMGLSVRRAILCCQAYHGRRALLYYQLLYPETRFFVCPAVTRNISRETWHQTYLGTELVLGEMERCGSQFHTIFHQKILDDCSDTG